MNWVLKAKRKKKLELILLKARMCKEKQKERCQEMAKKKPNNKRMGQRKWSQKGTLLMVRNDPWFDYL